MSKTAVAVILVLLALVALVAYSMRGVGGHACEVCIEFDGRTECRTAKGATKEEAVRTASENACALLTSGMTESIRCSRTPPSRVKCE